MKLVDEFRQRELAAKLIRRIRGRLPRPVTLMEVCGTHTMSVARHGLGRLLPPEIRLLSGPGCPVCVTPAVQVDTSIALARQPDCIITTFGDMMRVPGSGSSLEKERAAGRDIRVVTSCLDALEIARRSSGKRVVFFAVGFETTSPTVACTVRQAAGEGTDNFFILDAHKLIPPAMETLVRLGEVRIDGFLCPGHVSTIIGCGPYEPVARELGVPCVIAGFEPIDVLQGVEMLVEQIADGRAEVAVQYSRCVRPEGNPAALRRLYEVFEPADSDWRGLGTIPESGLRLRPAYARFSAREHFEISVPPAREPEGCRCGDVLRGALTPGDCGLFGTRCTPDTPVGPCMVSSEGTCATHFKWKVR